MSNAAKRIIGLGFVSGMRTTFGLAIMSHYLNKKSSQTLKHSKAKFIRTPVAAAVTKVLAAGEIYGDKLPTTPSRIAFPGVLGRVAAGMICGAVLAIDARESVLKGAILGGISATAGSYACYYIRQYIDSLPGVEDPYVGAAEDVLAIGLGVAVMQ